MFNHIFFFFFYKEANVLMEAFEKDKSGYVQYLAFLQTLQVMPYLIEIIILIKIESKMDKLRFLLTSGFLNNK